MRLTPIWIAALLVLTVSSVVAAVVLVRMELRTVEARKAAEEEHQRQVQAERYRVSAELEANRLIQQAQDARKAKFDAEIQAILKKDAAIRQARWDAEAAAATQRK
jgi:hypothetical protein